MSHSVLPYRPGVGIMLRNAEGLVFVAKRIDMRSEAWQMPQGGMDEGESPRTAALRELAEEIGTAQVRILAESADWYVYDLPADLIPQVWGGRFRGQRQKWFLMEFLGQESDINLATAHPEFSEYRWIKPGDLPEVIVPFKRQLYTALAEEFSSFF